MTEELCAITALDDEPTLSFELFPPKDAEGQAAYDATVSELVREDPTFLSVTYGANGSSRGRTLAAVAELRKEGVRTFGHLTCVSQTREEVLEVARTYVEMGADLLVVRGDPPGGPRMTWPVRHDGFRYVQEIIKSLRASQWMPESTCIAVGAYPTPHPTLSDPVEDGKVLSTKFAFGACLAVTQLHWTVDEYTELVARTRKHGGRAPIIPGVLVPSSTGQLRRLADMSGAHAPQRLMRQVADYGLDAGVEWVTELCEDLLKAGAPGVHFFTMNSTNCLLVVDYLRIAGVLKDRHR